MYNYKYCTIIKEVKYIILGTAIIDTLSDKNDNYEVSVTLNEVQCTTALSVLYNSEYVNGETMELIDVFEIRDIITNIPKNLYYYTI